jgi:outer membrane protein OmpA-like peptidoglycan-associated protein
VTFGRRFTPLLVSALLASLAGCAENRVRGDIDGARLPIAQTDRGVMIWLPEQVQFETGRSDFDETQALPHLNKLARLLQEKTGNLILIEGHTDDIGSAEFNFQLSLRRAEAVRSALIRGGVASERLKVAGYGRSRPIAPNDTEVGRALNRRVELIVQNEKAETLQRGEPANSFEAAFDRLRDMFGQAIPKSHAGD